MENEKKITLKLDVKGQEKWNRAKDSLEKGVGKTNSTLKELTTKILPQTNKAASRLLMLTKRATFYRVIGAGFRAISIAVKDGTKNLYEYSKAMKELGFGSDKRSMAYETMNGYTSLFLQLKNSIGAALAPVLQGLLPIIEAVTNAFIEMLNVINQVFSLLGGKQVGDNFTAATKANAEFLESSVGSAKELKKQLFGFDELNVLNKPNSGGGGSNTTDFLKYFEERKISEHALSLKLTIDDIFLNWDKITKEQLVEKVIFGLITVSGGFLGAAIGSLTPVGTMGGATIGATIGAGIALKLISATFDHDGTLSQEELLPLIKIALGGLVGGMLGFMIGNSLPATLAGAQIGVLVTAGAELDLMGLFFKENTTINADTANNLLITALGGLVGGAIGFALGKNVHAALAGAAIGMTVTGGVLVLLDNLATKQGSFIGQNTFLTGLTDTMILMTAASIGWKVGGLAGAAIGLTLAASVMLVIESITTGWTAESKRQLDDVGIKKEDLTRRVEVLNNYNKKDYQPRATGGLVTPGSMFLAGERGAELISATSNGVNVSTRDQIATSVASGNEGMVSALYAVANQIVNTINSQEYGTTVTIGDRDIVRAYDRGRKLVGKSFIEG